LKAVQLVHQFLNKFDARQQESNEIYISASTNNKSCISYEGYCCELHERVLVLQFLCFKVFVFITIRVLKRDTASLMHNHILYYLFNVYLFLFIYLFTRTVCCI
jgi:hypothetical protein